MYYIEQDNKIVFYNNTLEDLRYCLKVLPQYQDLPIQETEEGYTIVDYQLVTVEEAEEVEVNKAKRVKVQENDTVRDAALNAGVVYKDVLFDSDTDQKVNLLATIGFMSDEDTVNWFGKDNKMLVCNKVDLLNIGNMIIQLHSYCWTKNAEIKAAINNAKTMEELNSIEIDYSMEE